MGPLLIASTNPGKTREYRTLLSGLAGPVIGLNDVGITWDVQEDGGTFEENAVLKARVYAQGSGLLTWADDSGLCVDSLNGAPGVYSARYAPDPPSRIARLLSEMRDVPDGRRTARFVCIIAVARPDGEVHTFEGVCEGRIGLQPMGRNGFGYDPIFIVEGYSQTMAELPDEVKNQVSHRGRATTKALAWLRKLEAD